MQVVRNSGCSGCPHTTAAAVTVKDGAIQLALEPLTSSESSRNGARAYLARSCTEGAYNHSAYAALALLGKTLSFTVDLSAAGCGCNVAMYLVSMNQNSKPGTCDSDYYCDANNVCGVRCDEIDIIEANRHALHSTAHTPYDGSGKGAGLGGGWRSFTKKDFGPGGAKVDTLHPFRVHTSFGGKGGVLSSIDVTLEGTSGSIQYTVAPSDYLRSVSPAVLAGMTPVFSYWSTVDMRWLDSSYASDPYNGQAADPCPWDVDGVKGYPTNDNQAVCGDAASFSDFAITDAPPPGPAPSPPSPSPSHCAPAYGQCGGKTWTGPTCCVDGCACDRSSEWYQQCKPASSKLLSLELAGAVPHAQPAMVD